MVSSSQIREKIEQYLSARIDLDCFEDWYVRATWDMHRWGSRAAELLAFAVEESLSEHSSGHISQDELRRELSDLLVADNRRVAFDQAPIHDWSIEILPVAQNVHVSY